MDTIFGGFKKLEKFGQGYSTTGTGSIFTEIKENELIQWQPEWLLLTGYLIIVKSKFQSITIYSYSTNPTALYKSMFHTYYITRVGR